MFNKVGLDCTAVTTYKAVTHSKSCLDSGKISGILRDGCNVQNILISGDELAT